MSERSWSRLREIRLARERRRQHSPQRDRHNLRLVEPTEPGREAVDRVSALMRTRIGEVDIADADDVLDDDDPDAEDPWRWFLAGVVIAAGAVAIAIVVVGGG